jgi:hypothetical protein
MVRTVYDPTDGRKAAKHRNVEEFTIEKQGDQPVKVEYDSTVSPKGKVVIKKGKRE